MKKYFLYAAGFFAIALIIGMVMQQPLLYKSCAVATAVTLSVGIGSVPSLKGYQYTMWIISAVVAGMIFPGAFEKWGSVDLRDKTLILVIVQLVMFGMGTHMSLKDFSGLATTGKGVAVGLFCHFSIMPLMGFLLTRIFHFEPEIAAGIILIGSCSSGLASNVMVYLAKANLVLSVIVTAMATLAAPLLTPLLMKIFAGALVKINFIDMMMEIIKIVLVPIGAALLHDFLKRASSSQKRKIWILSVISAVWIALVILVLQKNITYVPLLESANLSAFFAGAIIAGVVYHFLHRSFPKLDKIMPLISMFGIVYFTTVTTAAGRDNLMKVGLLLFLASVIHNAAGYFFGYWLSRFFGLDKNSSRTIAFEVGLQNGGMASGIAGSMGKLGTVGLAPAVFSPWMNISGSILANYWQRRPIEDNQKMSLAPLKNKKMNLLKMTKFFGVTLCVLPGFQVQVMGQKEVPQPVMERIYNEVKTPFKYGLVVVPGDASKKIDCPSVFRKGNSWYMTYIEFNGSGYETWLAKSKDLLQWKTLGRILSFGDTTNKKDMEWDASQRAGYIALQDTRWGGSYRLEKFDHKYWMSYIGGNETGYEAGKLSVGMAYTKRNVTKPHEWKRLGQPVLSATDKDVRWWENKKLYKSTVIWDKEKTLGHPFVMYYNANGDTSNNTPKWRWFERIGMAVSDDMVHWQRYLTDPVVHHKMGITGDGVIQKIGDVWVMFYFGAFWEGRKDAFNRFACSYDLINWTDWNGDDLVKPSEPYDAKYAHKSYVVKWKGVVYHFYCAVDDKDHRGIAVATSVDKGISKIEF